MYSNGHYITRSWNSRFAPRWMAARAERSQHVPGLPLVGSRVQLHGLRGKPHFNGCTGTVRSLQPNARMFVLLDSESFPGGPASRAAGAAAAEISVKVENVQVLRSLQRQGQHSPAGSVKSASAAPQPPLDEHETLGNHLSEDVQVEQAVRSPSAWASRQPGVPATSRSSLRGRVAGNEAEPEVLSSPFRKVADEQQRAAQANTCQRTHALGLFTPLSGLFYPRCIKTLASVLLLSQRMEAMRRSMSAMQHQRHSRSPL